jgi:hypothetical protein
MRKRAQPGGQGIAGPTRDIQYPEQAAAVAKKLVNFHLQEQWGIVARL